MSSVGEAIQDINLVREGTFVELYILNYNICYSNIFNTHSEEHHYCLLLAVSANLDFFNTCFMVQPRWCRIHVSASDQRCLRRCGK